jgi:exopolysaccharide biosynthesis polyprenyl glycosylphosphotransferase
MEILMDSGSAWASSRPVTKPRFLRRFDIYHRLLVIYDYTTAYAAWHLFAWAFTYLYGIPFNQFHGVIFSIPGLVYLVYFSAAQLYKQDHIFLFDRHLERLLKALALSSGMFTLVFILFRFEPSNILIPIIFFCLLILLLAKISRYRGSGLDYMFKTMGLGLITYAFLDLALTPEALALLNDHYFWVGGSVFCGFFMLAARFLLVNVIFNDWLKRYYRRQILIVGSDDQARYTVDIIIKQNAPIWVTGIVGRKVIDGPKKYFGSIDKLPAVCASNRIDELIIADKGLDKSTMVSVLDYCMAVGIQVWFPPSLFAAVDKKLYADDLCGIPMLKLCSHRQVWIAHKVKHALDAIISLPAILLSLPLFAVIAALIKLTSKGPVFYKARAIGKGGREFGMYKFRSMYVNSDAEIHKQFVTKLIKGDLGGGTDGKPLKITNDPRVTPVGRVLRRYSLDELPQLINVLKGEMSLVGPRPCLPYEYDIYQEWHKNRTSVRPGITGLWQVAGRSEVGFEDMILMDLYYVYSRSLWLDFDILIETVSVVLKKKGAY